MLEDLIKNNEIDQLERELEADPSRALEATSMGVSLLILAKYYRNAAAVTIIKKHLPDLSYFEAASVGDVTRLKELIDKDDTIIDSYAQDGFTALGLASYFGEKEVVKYLIKKGANVNLPANNDFKVAPLHSAVASQDEAMVDSLIEAGADVNARQMNNVVPLHSAAHLGNLPLVLKLMDHGADKYASTTDGKTALDFALEKGFENLKEYLC